MSASTPARSRRGARFSQALEVSGQRFTVELEVTEYDPPRAAASAFQIRGVDVETRYTLADGGATTTLTQSVEASGGGIKGRLHPDDPAAPRAQARGRSRGAQTAARSGLTSFSAPWRPAGR